MIYRRLFSLTKVRTRQGVYSCFSSRSTLRFLCSPHARIAAAVHTCTIRVRCVNAGLRMLLCYPMLYPRMRSPACWVISLPTCIYCHIVIHRVRPIWHLSERQSYRGCLLYDSRTCNRRTHRSSINSLMGNRWAFYLVSWQLPSDRLGLPHDFKVGAVRGATCPRNAQLGFQLSYGWFQPSFCVLTPVLGGRSHMRRDSHPSKHHHGAHSTRYSTRHPLAIYCAGQLVDRRRAR